MLAVHDDAVFLNGKVDAVMDIAHIRAAVAHAALVRVRLIGDGQGGGYRAGHRAALLLMVAHGGDDNHHVFDIHADFPQQGKEQNSAVWAVIVAVDAVAHVVYPAGDGGQFHLALAVSQAFQNAAGRAAHIAQVPGAVIGIAKRFQIAVARPDQRLDAFVLFDFLKGNHVCLLCKAVFAGQFCALCSLLKA